MASVSTYLNFNGNTEEAFEFYKTVFGNEYDEGGIMRMGDVPPQDGRPPMSDEVKKLVMHVSLETIAGHRIMGTDAIESMGFKLRQGNNVNINLEPDTRAEIDDLYGKLSQGGSDVLKPQEMFWGDYFGQCTDRFGVQWMFNTVAKE